ncbi:MAG: flavodoxin [Pseudomonadota bacterium]
MPLFAGVFGTAATPARAQQADGGALLAYVKRSGKTRVTAGALSRQFNARLFEIRTAEPYPDDYAAHVAQARVAAPEHAESLDDLASEQGVAAFPRLGSTMPAPYAVFLATADLGSKTIVQLITYGGVGTGSLPDTLAKLAPDPNARARTM